MEQLQHCDVGLPIDALYEILVRTHVKTLSRLRCVSKQWCSLISSTSFQVGHHRQNCREDPLLLKLRSEDDGLNLTTCLHVNVFTSLGNNIKEFSIKGLPQSIYSPIDSCKGFVCIVPWHQRNPIIVCNPTTEEFVMLPPVRGILVSAGIGYAPSSKELKVVRFYVHKEHRPDDGPREAFSEVFTLGSTAWRKTRNPPPQYHYDGLFGSEAPFLHGALHFAPNLERWDDEEPRSPCLFSFDMDTEVFTMFPLLEDFILDPRYHRAISLKVLGGSLCLISQVSFGGSVQIWCLRDYNNREWIKAYFIDAVQLGPKCCNIMPQVLMPDGSMMVIIKAILDREVRWVLYYYNFSNNSFTEETPRNFGLHFVESSLTLGSISCKKNL